MNTYIIGEQAKYYEFGKPISSNAIVEMKVPAVFPLEEIVKIERRSEIQFSLKEDTRVYGLGENLGGINKRGGRYESYCRDEANHTEDKINLYGAHNFFVIEDKEKAIGYFVDFPGRIHFDIGFTNDDEFIITINGENFGLMKIEGSTPSEIITKFLKTIGKPYIPPKWGFGYFQSRWGYRDQKEIQEVVDTFQQHEIPMDGIYLDLDYMVDFKNFTVSRERFPDFEDWTKSLKEKGLYLIPIIDAGVKIEEGYNVYEEGVKGDHFAVNQEGEPYVAAVWPGKVHFPDFFQEKTRRWFGEYYRDLTKMGIEGFWNDMNEPAIFYDEKSLEEAVDMAIDCRGKNLNVHKFFHLKDTFSNLLNDEKYHQRFYHRMDGEKKTNEEVHNLYGNYMTQSAYEGLSRHLDHRFLLISRASSIGMHRYGGIWTGDNASWWSHLEENVKMMPLLNMAGFFYTGADTGGFGGQCSGELLTRWLQFSIFTPLLRNHSALDTRAQEPYAFDKRTLEETKHLIRLRYRLIPYLYSTYMKAVDKYEMMFKPLAFFYKESHYKEIEDQLLLGDELMIAPVVERGKTGRRVDLPEEMAKIEFADSGYTVEIVKEGPHYLAYQRDRLIIFLKKGHMLPLGDVAMNVKELKNEKLDLLVYMDENAEHLLYTDDGLSIDRNDQVKTIFSVIHREGDFLVDIKNPYKGLKVVNFSFLTNEGLVKKTHRINS